MSFEHHTTDTESPPFRYWAQDFDDLPDRLKDWRYTPRGVAPFAVYATSNRGKTAIWVELEIVCDADLRTKENAAAHKENPR
jgi:hypothetical protein